MNYSDHFESIKYVFPELDLLKEDEFLSFKNEDFAFQCINSCIEFCNLAAKKLEITLNFSILYDYTFNAKAKVKNHHGVILFNIGLIERLESIISSSIEVFSKENIATLTILDNEKPNLVTLFSDLCLTYIFHHELAHILQMIKATPSKDFNFQEQYQTYPHFNIRNHIYELDADYFGITMSTIKLLKYVKEFSRSINTLLLFNLLTALSFSIANTIILFSNDNFKVIYYKNQSHPHPIIRILGFIEQILFLTSSNLQVQKEFMLVIHQRTTTMISQIQYDNKGLIDFSNLIEENFHEIENYIEEIESLYESFGELTRFSSQKIFDCLIA